MLAGALAGCLDELGRTTVSESFSDSHAVSGETTVAISNRNGPVTVREATGDEVTVSGEKRAGSQGGLDSISVDVTEGERFVVDVRFGTGSDFSNRSVDLTVEVPDGVAVDRANTANGDVTATGVRGDLHAATSNGDVAVTDVSGVVRAESANGAVTVRNATGLAGARTTNGNVDVDLLAMRGDVECRSSNGNVTVRVGPDVSAAIRLSTNSGDADVRDLPYTASTERREYVVGSLRGGEAPLLSLGTNNGDVTLRPV